MAKISPDLSRLRALAFTQAFSSRGRIADVMAAVEFVQFDPIQRPARAQDLILLQRVPGYRAGDLDRFYPRADLEEGFLYAYGALSPRLAALTHPKGGAPRTDPGLTGDVLAFVRERGPSRPQDVAAAFGKTAAVNGWGGNSAATTLCLEELHEYGLLRIQRRENGLKIYSAGTPPVHDHSPEERLRQLALAVIRVLAPVSKSGIGHALRLLCQGGRGGLEGRHKVVERLLTSGEIGEIVVDGVIYVAPADLLAGETPTVRRSVRLLAPFDPLVWERGRFEHLWGWPYRFEAYTPGHKRQFGYYALPMAWGDRIIGWANLEVQKDGRLDVSPGFVGRAYSGRDFRRSFDREISRFERFLQRRGQQ